MRNESQFAPLELWGGVECTVNRVGDAYFDQCARSGHTRRLDDLDRIAALGITALRYPVLWEWVIPRRLAAADWSWPDERLPRMRALGLRPIAGLVHHGSGPAHTSLLDPAFPAGLAAYAGAVAARYPWLDAFTPVNEPLTTARFSALYGHWYPHARDDCSFARALLTQTRATVMAMEAIRRVTPEARLVQTEDAARIYSTPHMAYQAEFENHRRWLSLDLLCGRVNRAHPLWGYLRDCSIPEAEILWFQDHPCPPDIVGLNVYLTSERWLDERVERFPVRDVGGNGRERYADVAAVHMLPDGIGGAAMLLREAWERYKLPLAISEAHLGCTREEQLRWLAEVWNAASASREAGADVRAVTIWSLLGAFDWNSLCTRDSGFYEPGAFDVRGPAPRPTALAALAAELATGKQPSHTALAGPGWWRRPGRFVFGPPNVPEGEGEDRRPEAGDLRPESGAWKPGASGLRPPVSGLRSPASDLLSPVSCLRSLLIVGAGGTLGRAFARLCELRGLGYLALARAQFDLADEEAVDACLAALKPWAVVNAAGYVRVDDAEREPEQCLAANCAGVASLAATCARHGARLLTFSSDLVFNGAKADFYVESDPAAPLNAYGRSKAQAEAQVLERLPQALVARTSAFFGPWDEANFVTQTMRALARGEQPRAVEDEVVSPTYVPDLVNASLDLLIDGERGIWHLANQGALSWVELARRSASLAGFDPERIVPVRGAALGRPARRPRYSALGSERGLLLPPLDSALERFGAEAEI